MPLVDVMTPNLCACCILLCSYIPFLQRIIVIAIVLFIALSMSLHIMLSELVLPCLLL